MISNSSKRVGIATLASLVAASIPAQGLRPLNIRSTYRLDVELKEPLTFVGTTPTGELEWMSPGEFSVTGPAPFQFPGNDGSAIYSPSGHKLLISGTSGYQTPGLSGQLSVISGGASSLLIEDIADYPGRDFLGCVFSESQGRIYAIDGVSNEVVWAPWIGVGAPLPSTNAFSVAATALDAPCLSAAYLHIAPEPTGFTVIDALREQGSSFSDAGGVWSIAPYEPFNLQPPEHWYVPSASSLNATEPFDVALLNGSGATSFDLVSTLGGVDELIGSHAHPGDGSVVSLVPPISFFKVPGTPYELRNSQLEPFHLRPQLRFGTPGILGNGGLGFHRDIAVPAHLLHLGSALFGYYATLDLGEEALQDTDVTVFGVVGFRGEANGQVNDPVVAVPGSGGVYTIENAVVLSKSVTFEAGERTKFVRFALPIADSSDLLYSVLLFQIIAVGPDSELALSTVVGSAVLGADGGIADLEAAAEASGAASAASSSPSQLTSMFPTDLELSVTRQPARVHAACSAIFCTQDLLNSAASTTILAQRLSEANQGN